MIPRLLQRFLAACLCLESPPADAAAGEFTPIDISGFRDSAHHWRNIRDESRFIRAVDGRLTGWCQQHDETTFEARPGRTFELASICPQETTGILRLLMRLENPAPELVQSVDAAVAWLDAVKLAGVRVERVKAQREEFLAHR